MLDSLRKKSVPVDEFREQAKISQELNVPIYKLVEKKYNSCTYDIFMAKPLPLDIIKEVREIGSDFTVDWREAECLVAPRFYMTAEVAGAILTGIPVVSPDWIYKSLKNFAFFDPMEYIISDPYMERAVGINVKSYITNVRKNGIAPLLRGYRVMQAPSMDYCRESIAYITQKLGGEIEDYNEEPHTDESYTSIVLFRVDDTENQGKQMGNGRIIMCEFSFLTHLLRGDHHELKKDTFYMYSTENHGDGSVGIAYNAREYFLELNGP
jgi:hypothetical protein